MAFELPKDYVDVPGRIREFRAKFPDGSLQQVKLEFIEFAGNFWVVYTAAAYRYPEDTRPGIGTAWEQVGTNNPYVKNSEVQNCETAAWGRAMVATLAVDTKKIASAEEVVARQYDSKTPESPNWVERAKTMDYTSLQSWYKMALKGGATQAELDAITAIGKDKTPGGTKTAEG